MNPTRREMLRLGLGSSTLLACGASLPGFLARSANALAGSASSTKGRILVVIQLDGGNDGLNTVIPHGDDVYRRARPKLQVFAKDVARIDDQFGLHPELRGFAKLLEKQQLAIVQGVGYPNPNRSHLESMTIWQTARAGNDSANPGWLARTIDAHASSPGDSPGLHIHDKFPLPRALAGGDHLIPSIDQLERLHRRIGATEVEEAERQRKRLDQLAAVESADPGSLLQFIEKSQVVTYASGARLASLKEDRSGSGYFEAYGLSQRLRMIARLIKSGLTTSIYYTQLDGFDTHADQQSRHPRLLNELGESTRAFLEDLEKSGEADRVMILVFSEFGRRIEENGSQGTDHGTSAPVFLLGTHVRTGLHGAFPDLAKLDDEGDPGHTTDFRSVYSAILDNWLGVPSSMILGGSFAPLPILKT